MKSIKVLIKYLVLPPLLIFFFNLLEYGFQWNRAEKFIYSLVLTVFTFAIVLRPKLKKYFLFLSLVALLLMVFIYLTGEIFIANIIGSFGFALLIIVISFYIPQIIKAGYVEKF